MIEASILDPDAQIASGYKAGVMPLDYGTEISQKELKQLIEFLSESAAKGTSSK